MTFSTLSLFFSKLEGTSSRIAITEMLARLFSHALPTEIDILCYLSLGRLVPLYESLEFQLAEKMIIRAIGQAQGMSVEAVKARYKKVGDLGEVVEQLKVRSPRQWAGREKLNVKTQQSTLSVLEVYQKLRKIAEERGEGSQKRKVEGLVSLLRELDPVSSRYVVRMVLGRLRLGFSDVTILDALSWMKTGTKELRPKLEQSYFVRADIGAIAALFKERGVSGLSGVTAKLGVPVMPALCQRLKTPLEMIEKMGKVAVEPKYDGARCVSGYTGLLLRNRGFVSVREARVGDEVLTHTGRFRPILALSYRFRRPGEKVYRFQTYLGNRFLVSEGHKFLVYENGASEWMPVETLGDRWVFFPRPTVYKGRVPKEWTYVDPANYSKTIQFNVQFFRFLGYWVGDGFSSSRYKVDRLGLIFNATDNSLILEYERIIKKVLNILHISRDVRRGSVTLYWRDPIFREWLCSNFRGEDRRGKRIPEWFMRLDRERFLSFLRGWKEADGTDRKGGNTIVTKERQLAMMGQVLGFAHGQPIGVRKVRLRANPTGLLKTYYELIIPRGNRYVQSVDGGYLVKVKTLKQIHVDGKLRLYDVQVKDDESFCTSIATLHNCQIHYKSGKQGWVRAFTRNLEEVSFMFPELQNIKQQIQASTVILDSEAVGYDTKTGKVLPFQEIITRKRKHAIMEAASKVPLRFFVFDILYKDGKSLLHLPLSERVDILDKTVGSGKILVRTERIVTEGPDELRQFHHKQLTAGLEGAVVKKWNASYSPGRRGYAWVKYKEAEEKAAGLSDTLDCVVMGYYRGRGKRASFGIGGFLVGISKGRQFITISKIGTGLTDEQWRELRKRADRLAVSDKPRAYGEVNKALVPDVWTDPQLVVEIAADNITRSPVHSAGLALRFPRLVRFRDDKGPEQVTTMAEVRRLYQLQGK